jgi:hypothetical protein
MTESAPLSSEVPGSTGAIPGCPKAIVWNGNNWYRLAPSKASSGTATPHTGSTASSLSTKKFELGGKLSHSRAGNSHKPVKDTTVCGVFEAKMDNSGLAELEEDEHNKTPDYLRNHVNRGIAKGKHKWLPNIGATKNGIPKQHALGVQRASGNRAAEEDPEDDSSEESKDSDRFDNEEAQAKDHSLSHASA